MAKIKTVKTDVDVMEFINSVPDERRRRDSLKLMEVIEEVTGFEPYMYGPSIVGFGNYHYKYATGHEGDAPLAGFSPRKAAMTLYFASRFPGRESLLKRLGKCKSSVSCVYIKKLEDIDLEVFKEMTKASVNHTKQLYPAG